MDAKDVLTFALAYYKDKVQSETIQRFHSEFDKLLEADAEARRLKATALVIQLAQLKKALQQLEMTYKSIREKVGPLEALDEYIVSIKREIKKISSDKNNHRFN